jgi:membrane protease YdiL (CAAX protease family)
VYPIIELFIIYGCIWFFNFGEFAGFESNFITQLTLLPMLLIILEGSYFAARSALGEEIGWRGFLVPKLLKKYSPNQVSIMVGLIWSVWHYPIMISGDYGSQTPILYQLCCFTLMIVGVNFIYTWLRLKSESLWSGVLLHTAGNLYIFHIFEDLTIDTGNTAYFAGETGAIFALWGSLLIFLFLRFGWDWPTTLYKKLHRRKIYS